MEFAYIYDRDSLPQENYKWHIIYCRHAEVLVKNELDVYKYLRFICVRSEAEKETLLSMLSDETKDKISGKIKVFTKDGIFFNNRFFVNNVSLVDGQVMVSFSNADKDIFTIKGAAKSLETGEETERTKENWKLPSSIRFPLYDLSASKGIEFSLYIDGHLVYKNKLFITKEMTV